MMLVAAALLLHGVRSDRACGRRGPFAADAAARCQEFFLADLRASAKAALNSVRVGKITTDDGQG